MFNKVTAILNLVLKMETGFAKDARKQIASKRSNLFRGLSLTPEQKF